MQQMAVQLGVIISQFNEQIMYNSVVFHPPKWINFYTNAIIMVYVICSDHTS